ncbi:MAG TPA: type IV toxin-antitoxin system AbiEi family antitoxin domain-containing protein [Nocardioides sp.]|nr:type IV toxin-antitoxin system AbiEi family antitoxin domain-containing protein [Nocardioides sp.]
MEPIDITEPFTCHDLARFGLSRRRLRRLLADGDVRRVVRGVYAPTALGDGLDVRVSAVALVLADGQVACDRTAAWLHGINLYTYAEHDVGLVVETCAGPGRAAVRRSGVDGHRRSLRDDEVLEVRGVAMTTPLRTALDLACILERRDALAALDAFRRDHDLDPDALAATLRARYRGRRGVIQARELVSHSDPRAESVRESWMRLSIVDAGLPSPEPQVWIEVAGVPTYRVDLAYRRKRVAVEYDGYEAHESTPALVAATEERRAWLRAHGWTVIVVRNGDFSRSGLDRWIGELRRALRPTYTNRRRLERGSRHAE